MSAFGVLDTVRPGGIYRGDRRHFAARLPPIDQHVSAAAPDRLTDAIRDFLQHRVSVAGDWVPLTRPQSPAAISRRTTSQRERPHAVRGRLPNAFTMQIGLSLASLQDRLGDSFANSFSRSRILTSDEPTIRYDARLKVG
ncbi:hypothetical protein K227x_20640 [Rubripirellula lacrimiformis]|uniref:Uncharacterized protein n=1 Tax=Rubripirellula lacrimiformis TaxID=1930273 RepID=A0A517N960_9BACT|nr:hypothetical protein K227x_20640 [Rubripirellula lacrimiformis]